MKEFDVKWREARRAIQCIGSVLLCCCFVQIAILVGIASAQVEGCPPPDPPQTPEEAFCRSCHGDKDNCDSVSNRHHILAGSPAQTIPSPSAVPFPQPGVTEYECLSCHQQELDPVDQTLKFVPFRDCTVCHIDAETAHHNNTHAQEGDCMWCHNDPRPEIEPSATTIPTGQLACRQCHGAYQHDNGGPIQDFSFCFGCHEPLPYHAKPTGWPGWYEENASMTGYASGRGSFNLYYSQLRPRCAPDCEDEFEHRPGYDEDGPPAKDAGRNWRYPAIDYNMITFIDYRFFPNREWTVPTFEGTSTGTGGGGTPPPQYDSVNITYAQYDNSRQRLTVYATNSEGSYNTSLSVIYRGHSYAMSWNRYNNRWEVTISTSSCESTVQVVSTAGGSATSSVSGCSSSPPQTDTVNITRAEYSSDRLTVYAENSLGHNSVSLTVMYNNNSYSMNWDSGDDRWEVRISTSRCNDSTIEVVSSAGGSDSSSVSGCSSYSYRR